MLVSRKKVLSLQLLEVKSYQLLQSFVSNIVHTTTTIIIFVPPRMFDPIFER